MTDFKHYRLRPQVGKNVVDVIFVIVALTVLPYALGFLAHAFWLALKSGWGVLV